MCMIVLERHLNNELMQISQLEEDRSEFVHDMTIVTSKPTTLPTMSPSVPPTTGSPTAPLPTPIPVPTPPPTPAPTQVPCTYQGHSADARYGCCNETGKCPAGCIGAKDGDGTSACSCGSGCPKKELTCSSSDTWGYNSQTGRSQKHCQECTEQFDPNSGMQKPGNLDICINDLVDSNDFTAAHLKPFSLVQG